jgi:hypothetical protein
MSNEAAIFEPVVNRNFAGGFHHKIIDHRLGDNGPRQNPTVWAELQRSNILKPVWEWPQFVRVFFVEGIHGFAFGVKPGGFPVW